MSTRRPLTEPEARMMRELYPHTETAELAEKLGRSIRCVYYAAARLGLKKSPELIARLRAEAGQRIHAAGTVSRFEKGTPPWNKGMKGLQIGGLETRFKKGHLGGQARNRLKPVGAERWSEDGYLERKVNNDMPLHRRWRAVHLLVWEAANGPMPDGHCLWFRDRDKTNTSLDNLELITRAENMRRNSIHTGNPPELVQLSHLRGVLTRQINKRQGAKK